MGDFFKSARFKILLAVLVVLGAFMLRAAYMGGLGTMASYAVGVIAAPFQKVSAQIAAGATDFFDTFLRADEYKMENEALKERIRELNQQMIDYETYRQENQQYKQFLEIKDKNQDFQFELATVIGRSPDERFYSFTIDKGSVDGIKLRDPVITADGLVGYVSQLNPTYAKVQTILDPSVRVSCQNIRTRDTGIVTGTIELADQGMCKLAYIDRESAIAKGDIIVTSGVSGTFPKNLVVGVVDEVRVESHGISLYAQIKPASEIKNVKDVLVIKSFAGQAEQKEPSEQAESGPEPED